MFIVKKDYIPFKIDQKYWNNNFIFFLRKRRYYSREDIIYTFF